MAALDFPDAPTLGEKYDKWTWDGTMWVLTAGGGSGGGSDEVFIGPDNPDVADPSNTFELWVDPDATIGLSFPQTYAEETAAAEPGGTEFPVTYGDEKTRAATGETADVPVLRAKVGGVWTDVGSAAGGAPSDFPSTYDELVAAASAP
jgi:hypothetical protein